MPKHYVISGRGEAGRMEGQEAGQCCFQGVVSGRCHESVVDGGEFCFWHAPDLVKSSEDLIGRLEERAKTERPMEGFQLKGVCLDGLNLVRPGGKSYQLINCDLSRCSLKNSHLYRLDLSGTNLLKADFYGANLHRVNLTGSNLLGANLKLSKMQNVILGDLLFQEQNAYLCKKTGDKDKAKEWLEEAEEVARNIRKHFEYEGLLYEAGLMFYKEMLLHHYRLPKWSLGRVVSKVVNLLSGYGEKPERVVAFSAAFIFCCSIFYFLFGIQDSGQVIQYQSGHSLMENARNWLDTLYFSVVTFTTLGYGDLAPLGISRLFAAIEAFVGSFTLALFVVVFVKKMTR